MSLCAACNQGFDGDTIATCSICLDHFHANERTSEGCGKNCSGALTSEIRVIKLRNRNLMVYRCKSCSENGGECPRLLDAISDLQESLKKLNSLSDTLSVLTKTELPRINKDISDLTCSNRKLEKSLKNHISECSKDVNYLRDFCNELDGKLAAYGNVDNSSLPVDKYSESLSVIEEIERRKRSENNLIIFGVPEQVKHDGSKLDSSYDFQRVASALGKIQNLSTVLDKSRIRRLGKFVVNKNRPILVRFDDRKDVSHVITHWRLIPGEYHVSYDLTKLQRTQFNRLRDEAKTFNNLPGNKDKPKKIVNFVNGDPKIVTMKAKRAKEPSGVGDEDGSSSGVSSQKN